MINLRIFASKLHPDPVATAIAACTWTLPAVTSALIGVQVSAAPAVIPAGLVGLGIFAPLPAFYYLIESGRSRGLATLALALLISGIVSFSIGQSWAFMSTLLMMPAGIALYKSTRGNIGNPAQAGLSAFLVLLLVWCAWVVVSRISLSASPDLYGDLILSLDQGLIETGKTLKENAQIGPEQALEIETTVTGLRGLLPKVMPGLLLTTMLNTVFLNMVVGQYLLRRKKAELAPWPAFATWRLPEPLVALVILAGISLLVPVPLINDIGLNLLLVSGTLYFFQGLTLLTGLLNRWSVPGALRFLIFLLVLVQAYGIVLLAIAGLVDVWADFRRPRPKPEVFED